MDPARAAVEGRADRRVILTAPAARMTDSKTTPLPAWARLLDAVCLLLLLLATVIFLSGGFRVRLGAIRLALTSPVRLLLWAVGLGIVRHVLAPRRPIYADLPARLRAAWRTPEFVTALQALVGTRLVLLLAGYLAIFLIGYPAGRPPWRLAENEFANLPARWDVGWYLGIAVDGYSFRPGAVTEQQNIVFFPAMPMLMRVAGRLLGGSPVAYLWGGTLVALLAFGGGLIYLFRFARDMLKDERAASTAVWLTATYPFGLWYGVPYTESLYLLGATAAFYHFRRAEHRQASAWGLLVGLTRPNGCFLSIPLAVLAIEPWLPAWLRGGDTTSVRSASAQDDPGRGSLPQVARAVFTAAWPGFGVLLYCAYIWQLTGSPLSWAEGHVAWGRSYQGLSILVTDRYRYLSEAGVYAYTSQGANDFVQLMGVVFALAATWPVARRLGLAYAVFILINLLPPMAAGGLLSAGRFSSVLFPVFVWAATRIDDRGRSPWLSSFMALQTLNAIIFYTWREMI